MPSLTSQYFWYTKYELLETHLFLLLQIPLSAVEMPEDAMAALDVQFSGLEFGTETFDFTADVKSSSANAGLVSTTPVSVNVSINARNPTSSTPPATKDLTSASLSSSLPPSQKVRYIFKCISP